MRKSSHLQKSYASLKEKVTKYSVWVGIFACLFGGSYNYINGYSPLSVIIHVIGFALLIILKIGEKSFACDTICFWVFIYFCFVYTPAAWMSLEGVFCSITYVICIFCVLMVTLLEEETLKFMLTGYLALVSVLMIGDLITGRVSWEGESDLYSLSVGFTIMLAVLVILSLIVRRQILNMSMQINAASITDPLTGAYNARYLAEKIDELENDFQRCGKNYSIAIFDIDNFKTVNDAYGHVRGDEVLKRATAVTKELIDPDTVLCRYGGDEFVLLFIGKEKAEAYEICENIRNGIAKPMNVILGKLISVSMGLCERCEIEDKKDILSCIDVKMYCSKAAGKNRVT